MILAECARKALLYEHTVELRTRQLLRFVETG
jgi:hypothetical protein